MFKKSKAFTLAEALTVIVIIGVIAAISLPILQKSYLTKSYQAALKKNFYVLNTALERYETDNFRKIKGTDTTGFVDKLVPYLNVHKTCPATGEEGNNLCPLATDYESYNEYGKYDEAWRQTLYKFGSIILNDSSLIMIGKKPRTNGNGVFDTMTFFYIDVNGYEKGPNRMGEDLYAILLTKEGTLEPAGIQPSSSYNIDRPSYCNKKTTWNKLENGMTCSYYVLREK